MVDYPDVSDELVDEFAIERASLGRIGWLRTALAGLLMRLGFRIMPPSIRGVVSETAEGVYDEEEREVEETWYTRFMDETDAEWEQFMMNMDTHMLALREGELSPYAYRAAVEGECTAAGKVMGEVLFEAVRETDDWPWPPKRGQGGSDVIR